MSDEWFEDEEIEEEEYINDENDPQAVEKITTKEDYTIPEKEEVIEFDEVFETVRSAITDLTKYDHMMEKKVFDALRMGKLK